MLRELIYLEIARNFLDCFRDKNIGLNYVSKLKKVILMGTEVYRKRTFFQISMEVK